MQCSPSSKLRWVACRTCKRTVGSGCRVQGYRIHPAPYLNDSTHQTAGTIEKDTPEGVTRNEFVLADEAIAFTITKAQQLIDQRGDRMFK